MAFRVRTCLMLSHEEELRAAARRQEAGHAGEESVSAFWRQMAEAKRRRSEKMVSRSLKGPSLDAEP